MSQKQATAIVLRSDAVHLTTLRQVKGVTEVEEQKRLPFDPPLAPEEMQSVETAHRVRAAAGHLKGDLCAAIPADKVLMRVVDLPTSDPDEMRSMADLQVDKFSPFPVEHMSVSVELLSQKDKSSRVLIVAVQRTVIDAAGVFFGAAGVLPRWVDVDVLGWWRLLKDHGAVPAAGRGVILLADRMATELIICQDGAPVVLRSLGTAQGITEEEFHAELADEIGYSLTSLETERGVAETSKLSLWCWGDGAPPKVMVKAEAASSAVETRSGDLCPELAAKLREVCGLQVETRSLASLPELSEGLARRAMERGPVTVDLAPAEWQSTEHSRKTQKGLIIATAAFVFVWLLGIAAFFTGLKLEQGRLVKLKTEVAALEGPADEVRQLNDRIKSFEIYADRSHTALESLREVSSILPGGIDLTSFTYKKGNEVVVRGEADSAEPIYAFFQALEQADFFDQVKPEAVRQKTSGNRQRSEFSVTAKLPGGEKP